MNATADASFGPRLSDRFDTLKFEQAVFSIGPSAVLSFASPLRIAILARRQPTFRADALLWFKMTFFFYLAFGWLNWRCGLYPHRLYALESRWLFPDVVAMGSLLYAEHRYSHSPSTMISLYLSVTILLETASIRSLFLRGGLFAFAIVSVAALAVKLLLLALEEIPKRELSAPATFRETSSVIWNRSVF